MFKYSVDNLDCVKLEHFFCLLKSFSKLYQILKKKQSTGKSLSEALLFAEHGENMLCKKIVLNVRYNFCTQHVLPRFELGIFMYWTCNSMNNLLSYCGLVDAKIRASDKDLTVLSKRFSRNCKINYNIFYVKGFTQF